MAEEAQTRTGEIEADKAFTETSHVSLARVVTAPVDMTIFLRVPLVESVLWACVTNAVVSSPDMAMPVMVLN